jgi:GNAT superfamily N-acetyltransferase
LRYPKEIVLKDGSEAFIRPLEQKDETLLKQFYGSLSENDRWYMPYDMIDAAMLRKWIDGVGKDYVFSIVAVAEEKIVAHASLHVRYFGSTRNVGRLHIMVLDDYRHKRLGTWMLLDLIQLAMDKGLLMLRADFVVGIEDAAIEAAYKLDFFKQAVLEGYAVDPQGKPHDMMIMTKRLHKEWSDF